MNYEHSKIYKIIGNVPDDPCYVGSTTKKYLSQRMAKHVSNYKLWSKSMNKNKGKIMSFELFDKYGVENCKIILLESVNAQSKDELRMKEQVYIDKLDCINKYRAHITLEQQKQKRISYYQANKTVLNEWKKEYYANNRDLIKRQRKYHEVNREQMLAKSKKYRLDNAEKLKLKKQKKYTCLICETEVTVCKRNRHEGTPKHFTNTINYMKSFIDKYTEQIKNESNIIQHFSLE